MNTRSFIAAAALAALTSAVLAPSTAAAQDPAPDLSVSNGATECWARGATLRHFIVFNDGNAAGRYTVEFRREDDDELRSYTRRVAKRQGVNDGLVIPAGESIAYVRVSSRTQGTLYLRSNVTGLARCAE